MDKRRITTLGKHLANRAALEGMLLRGRGAVAQVGSALAYRGISLQSAYCGAKLAAQGSPSPSRASCCTRAARSPSRWCTYRQ
jgi:hypothetical protein